MFGVSHLGYIFTPPSVGNLHCYLSYNFHILLHQDLSHGSSSPFANPDSTVGSAMSICCKQHNHDAIEKKRSEHFSILHLYDRVLFSSLCSVGDIWTEIYGMGNGMGHHTYYGIYELIHQPDIVLLAPSRTTSCRCKDS